MRASKAAARGPCPCGTGQPYMACCGPFHAGEAEAPTPEALMRSRYSAYALGLADYLLATWHPATAPGELDLPPIKWVGLEVLQAEAAGDAGVVQFTARYKQQGRAGALHETSRFARVDGRWRYIDGVVADDGTAAPTS